jgi:hypothetical protein
LRVAAELLDRPAEDLRLASSEHVDRGQHHRHLGRGVEYGWARRSSSLGRSENSVNWKSYAITLAP